MLSRKMRRGRNLTSLQHASHHTDLGSAFLPPWPLMRTYSEFGMHANSPIILCIQVWRLHGLACVCALPVPQLGSRMKDTSLKRTPTIPVAASHQTVAWQWVF